MSETVNVTSVCCPLIVRDFQYAIGSKMLDVTELIDKLVEIIFVIGVDAFPEESYVAKTYGSVSIMTFHHSPTALLG